MTDILTVVLIVVTAVYTFYTHKMASIMKETYLLERRPYLTFTGLEIIFVNLLNQNEQTTTPGIQVSVGLQNVGKTMLKYEVVSFEVEVNGTKVNSPNFINSGSTLFPGAITVYKYPIIPYWMHNPPIPGILSYTLRYWNTTEDKVFIASKRMNFEVISLNPTTLNWTFVAEHDD